jgi:tRNA(fMet)-specific endonuclease VapC
MTPIVVDTDVVSFLFKNDSRAQLYLPLLRNHELLISFMTEAELEHPKDYLGAPNLMLVSCV